MNAQIHFRPNSFIYSDIRSIFSVNLFSSSPFVFHRLISMHVINKYITLVDWQRNQEKWHKRREPWIFKYLVCSFHTCGFCHHMKKSITKSHQAIDVFFSSVEIHYINSSSFWIVSSHIDSRRKEDFRICEQNECSIQKSTKKTHYFVELNKVETKNWILSTK